MNAIIDDFNSNIKIIDKDNLIYEDNNTIAEFKYNNIKDESNITKIINIISILNEFTDNEIIIYKYIIDCIIYSDDNYTQSEVIKFNSYNVPIIAKNNNIGCRSVYRAIDGLIAKKVIKKNVNNGQYIPTEYILNKEYDCSKYLYKDKIKYLLIKFV